VRLAVFVVVDVDAEDAETARLVGHNVAAAYADTSQDGGVAVGPVRVLVIPGDGETALRHFETIRACAADALQRMTSRE